MCSGTVREPTVPPGVIGVQTSPNWELSFETAVFFCFLFFNISDYDVHHVMKP